MHYVVRSILVYMCYDGLMNSHVKKQEEGDEDLSIQK